jgi:hypothetical protein
MTENSQPNSQKFYQKKPFIFLVAGVLVFGAGFWSGQEYMRYQIKQSIADVFSGIGNYTQSQAKSESKQKTRVKFGESAKIEDFNISIAKIKNEKEIKKEYYEPQIAKNEWLVITLNGENQSKKAGGFYLGNVKLISNGAEYNKSTALSGQLDKKDVLEGFETCLECSINPNEKAQAVIYFDVKSDTTKDKLVIKDFEFDLK